MQGRAETGTISTAVKQTRALAPPTEPCPGEVVGTCQGPRWQFHRRGSPWTGWSQHPEALLTPSQATFPLLPSPNWMVTPEAKGKRSVNEDSNRKGRQSTETPWRESRTQQVWETLSEIRRRAGWRGHNKTWGKRGGMWSPRGSLGAHCKVCWKPSHFEVISGIKNKPGESPGCGGDFSWFAVMSPGSNKGDASRCTSVWGTQETAQGWAGVHRSLPVSLIVDWQTCKPVWKFFSPTHFFPGCDFGSWFPGNQIS